MPKVKRITLVDPDEWRERVAILLEDHPGPAPFAVMRQAYFEVLERL